MKKPISSTIISGSSHSATSCRPHWWCTANIRLPKNIWNTATNFGRHAPRHPVSTATVHGITEQVISAPMLLPYLMYPPCSAIWQKQISCNIPGIKMPASVCCIAGNPGHWVRGSATDTKKITASPCASAVLLPISWHALPRTRTPPGIRLSTTVIKQNQKRASTVWHAANNVPDKPNYRQMLPKPYGSKIPVKW